MSLNSPSELIRVIQACRDNNRLAQKELYQHFYGYGMSVAFRYVNDREDAVEILNTAFVKIFKNLDSYDIEKPLKPWIRRIMVNTAIDFLRVRRRIADSGDIELAPEPGVQESVTSNLAYEEILKLIQQLSPSYRTVFNLFVIEGYKHEEIADMLGISVGTSKSNLFKAKAHLRVALEKLEAE
ncbi:RNA polymerase sigma factor [Phaeocystidibacter luteus]|uniref:RNA polymerase sigma factor n=1 Tax=Phaeocystidibacter luteus TaxID=911197 RepID=A0A6N6RMH0_9FLAO|nr:RNA polymerase sigma factor [Phaeocystidibacter luteus]KAB2814766.1 RNA polymerase sigma factor [Phaeocystidibacter luteus]